VPESREQAGGELASRWPFGELAVEIQARCGRTICEAGDSPPAGPANGPYIDLERFPAIKPVSTFPESALGGDDERR
jgi:hypothetical protein